MIRQYRERTGGGPACPHTLSDDDSLIITICNIEALDGCIGNELGIPTNNGPIDVSTFFVFIKGNKLKCI